MIEQMNKLSASARKLWMILASQCDGELLIEATIDSLTEILGVQERAFRLARAELEKEGFIKTIKTANRRSHLYKVEGRIIGVKFGVNENFRGGKENAGRPMSLDALQKYNEGTQIHSASTPTEKFLQRREKDKNRQKKKRAEGPVLSPSDELLVYEAACKIVGARFYPNSVFADYARRSLRARIREGYSKEDLLEACRSATKEWDSGHKWRDLKNLRWIWSRGFEPLLASKGEYGRKKPASQFREGEAKQQWLDHARAKLERDDEKTKRGEL